MATMWTILRHLNKELEQHIQAIKPNTYKSDKFIARPREEEVSDFSATVRANRMFQIDPPVIIDAPGVELFIGTNNRNPRIVLPIRFSYENTDEWTHAMLDDYDKISAWFLNNNSAVSGVQIRTIDDPPRLDKRPSDGVIIMTLDVVAVLAVTA